LKKYIKFFFIVVCIIVFPALFKSPILGCYLVALDSNIAMQSKYQIIPGDKAPDLENWLFEYVHFAYNLSSFTEISPSEIVTFHLGEIRLNFLKGAIQGFYYRGENLAYNGSGYKINYGVGVSEFSKFSSFEYEYHFNTWANNISVYVKDNKVLSISKDDVWIVANYYELYDDHIDVTVYRYYIKSVSASSRQICMIFDSNKVMDVWINGSVTNANATDSFTAGIYTPVGYIFNGILVYFKVSQIGVSKGYRLINAEGTHIWTVSFKPTKLHYSEAEITFFGARVNRGVYTPKYFMEYVRYSIFWVTL